jgi:outer membrane protein TolC
MRARTGRIRRVASLVTVLAAAGSVWNNVAEAQSSAPAPATGALTLADVVALALRNNPQTQLAYAQARAAAAAYSASQGSYLPSIGFTAPVSRTRTLSGSGGAGAGRERTQFTPGLSLSYLLLDFGGRGGTVAQARATALAASEQSDAAVKATVLEAEATYFSYNAARDLRTAEQANVAMAEEARTAALQRWRVGLATVADTLQAATALAQAQLAELTAEGQLHAARGALAAAMGTRADAPFDVSASPGEFAMQAVSASVDSLMSRAVRERPELAAAEAQLSSAQAQVRVVRSAALPSLTMGGTAGRSVSDLPQLNGNTYGLTFGLSFPVFSGFARRNAIRAAHALVDAARAEETATRVEVANQVYTSYSALQVESARVRAAAQLLASAVESEQVARGRYTEGVGTLIDLLTAQTALANARAQSAQSRWFWQTALVQLAHDVGVLDRNGDPQLNGGEASR